LISLISKMIGITDFFFISFVLVEHTYIQLAYEVLEWLSWSSRSDWWWIICFDTRPSGECWLLYVNCRHTFWTFRVGTGSVAMMLCVLPNWNSDSSLRAALHLGFQHWWPTCSQCEHTKPWVVYSVFGGFL